VGGRLPARGRWECGLRSTVVNAQNHPDVVPAAKNEMSICKTSDWRHRISRARASLRQAALLRRQDGARSLSRHLGSMDRDTQYHTRLSREALRKRIREDIAPSAVEGWCGFFRRCACPRPFIGHGTASPRRRERPKPRRPNVAPAPHREPPANAASLQSPAGDSWYGKLGITTPDSRGRCSLLHSPDLGGERLSGRPFGHSIHSVGRPGRRLGGWWRSGWLFVWVRDHLCESVTSKCCFLQVSHTSDRREALAKRICYLSKPLTPEAHRPAGPSYPATRPCSAHSS
jgi:hypothetical protein